LHPVMAHVHDIDGAVRLIDGNASRKIELTVAVAEAAPRHDEFAWHVEFLHPEGGTVDDVDIHAHAIHATTPWRVQLPLDVAARAEIHEVTPQLAVALLDAVIVR